MFTLTINTDGAAFAVESNDEHHGTPDPAPELARLLEIAALHLRDGRTGGTLTDRNGNRVGSFALVAEDEPAQTSELPVTLTVADSRAALRWLVENGRAGGIVAVDDGYAVD